jgi:hypothetical protein
MNLYLKRRITNSARAVRDDTSFGCKYYLDPSVFIHVEDLVGMTLVCELPVVCVRLQLPEKQGHPGEGLVGSPTSQPRATL